MSFVAPNAKILVVDDNRMSLKLTGNLFASFQIQADCAEGGAEALEMIKKQQYQMIFMDYMMPEMDGVETTRVIRSMEGEQYKKVPIIALTGDEAVDRDVLAKVGICDVLFKPLERDFLKTVLEKWLPDECLMYEEDKEVAEERGTLEELPYLEGINWEEGLKNSGTKEHLLDFLCDFYHLIDVKADKMEKSIANNQIKEYTIEVHALKHSARIIGAVELSRLFGMMELIGKAEEREALHRNHPQVLAKYLGMKQILAPLCVKSDTVKREVGTEEMLFYLQGLQEATESFDLDHVDEAMKQLEGMAFPKECEALLNKLRVAVADVKMEHILILSEELISLLKYR